MLLAIGIVWMLAAIWFLLDGGVFLSGVGIAEPKGVPPMGYVRAYPRSLCRLARRLGGTFEHWTCQGCQASLIVPPQPVGVAWDYL